MSNGSDDRVEKLIFDQMKRIGDRQEEDSKTFRQVLVTMENHSGRISTAEKSLDKHEKRIACNEKKILGLTRFGWKAAGGGIGGSGALYMLLKAIGDYLK